MSQALASLKLVNAKRHNTVDPVLFRRTKLSEKLSVQIDKSLQSNQTFAVDFCALEVKVRSDGLDVVINNRDVDNFAIG
jgi:hypothetical protein